MLFLTEDRSPEQGHTPALCLLLWGHLHQKGRAFRFQARPRLD